MAICTSRRGRQGSNRRGPERQRNSSSRSAISRDVLRLRTYARRQRKLPGAPTWAPARPTTGRRVIVEDQIGYRFASGTARPRIDDPTEGPGPPLLPPDQTRHVQHARSGPRRALAELDPVDALNSLNQTVYFLRRVLEERYVDDLSPGYLHHDSDLIWLDPELVTSRSNRMRSANQALPADAGSGPGQRVGRGIPRAIRPRLRVRGMGGSRIATGCMPPIWRSSSEPSTTTSRPGISIAVSASRGGSWTSTQRAEHVEVSLLRLYRGERGARRCGRAVLPLRQRHARAARRRATAARFLVVIGKVPY